MMNAASPPTLRSAVFLTVLSALLAGSITARAENRALLIGIGYYEVEGVELPGVDHDISMMREVALKLGYTRSQIKILSHSEATLDSILDSIEDWLIDGTTPEDRVLFYHSGHGTVVEDRDGDEADGSDEALLPYDFTGGLSRRPGSKPTRVLLDDDLGRLLTEIPAREVIALVDSCHSGTVTRGIRRRNKLFYPNEDMPSSPSSSLIDKRVERYESVILLSAAEPDQEAQTSEKGALFTRGVHEAVTRAAPGRHLTLEKLRQEADVFIRDAVGPREKLRHNPTFDGNRALAGLNLFLPIPWEDAGESEKVTQAPVPAPPPPADLWRDLEVFVRDAGAVLSVHTNQEVYREGESLEISVAAPFDGYLHVLNVGDGEDELVLLYPNRYQRKNHVRRGATVHVPEPGRFRLPARLPAGQSRQKNLVAVVYTRSPLNLYDQPTTPEEAFRILRSDEVRTTLRSFRPEAPHAGSAPPSYVAGQVVVTIEDGG